MTFSVGIPDTGQPRYRKSHPIQPEGADGRFSQTWYPICLAAELAVGQIRSAELLGGRVIAFRSAEGSPRVFSAYCPHLGADLAVGSATPEGGVKCRFHGWRFDGSGVCTATEIGDDVPPGAALFRFPAIERHGIVWAFNGHEPLFALPEIPGVDDSFVSRALSFEHVLATDPWVVASQTPDLQHLLLQHDFSLTNDPADGVGWTDYSLTYPIRATMRDGTPFEVDASIYGTNIYLQTGTISGRWFYWVTGLGLPRPQMTTTMFAYGTARLPGETREQTEAVLDRANEVMMGLLSDDGPVLMSIHYNPGMLTESDWLLKQFVEYVRAYPRANPAADFIN